MKSCLTWAKEYSHLLSYSEARYLFVEVLGLSELELDQELSGEHVLELNSILERLRLNKPFAYIVKNQPFLGEDFYVDNRVLIPRPETEELVLTAEELIKENFSTSSDNIRVLECCTGSGVVATSLKMRLPQVHLEANDLSDAALDVAKANAEAHGVNISFSKQDVLLESFWDSSKTSLNMIVANPPYISLADYENLDESVKSYEPQMALVAESDGLAFYRFFAEHAGGRLCDGGFLVAEIGFNQRVQLLKIYEQYDWHASVKKDIFGKDRFLIASPKR